MDRKISPGPSLPSGPGAAPEGLLPRREALWAGGQRGVIFLPLVSDPERSLTRRVKGGEEGFYKIMSSLL